MERTDYSLSSPLFDLNNIRGAVTNLCLIFGRPSFTDCET
jgi:hypothetical protein